MTSHLAGAPLQELLLPMLPCPMLSSGGVLVIAPAAR
jgi:hypothetical protein